MKKILFSSAAAICAAVGFMSAKPAKFTTFYWFKAVTNYAKGSTPTGILPSNVTYSSTSTTKPVTSPCATGANYICLVGFTAAQVTALGKHLGTNASGYTIRTAAYTRP